MKALADRIARWVPHALAAGATILVVVLGLEVRELRTRLQEQRLQRHVPYPGLIVPTFRAATLAADTVQIGRTAAGRHQLLFVFDTGCPFCLRTIPAWKRIANWALHEQPGSLDVFGISLDPEPEARRYVAEHQLPFPVVTFPEENLADVYHAANVPTTLLLAPTGSVVHGRTGVIPDGSSTDSLLATLEKALESAGAIPDAASRYHGR